MIQSMEKREGESKSFEYAENNNIIRESCFQSLEDVLFSRGAR